MSSNARVARGRRTQVVVAEWLRGHGHPRAKPAWGSMPGRDVLQVPRHAIEVKARGDWNPQAWLRQSVNNAGPKEKPCVIARLNRQGEDAGQYLVVREWHKRDPVYAFTGIREFTPLAWLRNTQDEHEAGKRPSIVIRMNKHHGKITYLCVNRLADDELNGTL